jgi:hypothetical protein
MTTRMVAVPRTETKAKEKKRSWIRRAIGAVVAPALLVVAVFAVTAVFARMEEEGSADGFQ